MLILALGAAVFVTVSYRLIAGLAVGGNSTPIASPNFGTERRLCTGNAPIVFPTRLTGRYHPDLLVESWVGLELGVAQIGLWGDNLISASGEMWKRHRRIMAPAFTTKTHSLVAAETVAIYKKLVFAEGWKGQDTVTVIHNHILHKLTLIIIARCGFGIRGGKGGLSNEFTEDKLVLYRVIILAESYKMPTEHSIIPGGRYHKTLAYCGLAGLEKAGPPVNNSWDLTTS
ncbi:hypothetical protein B0H17DRAFT_1139944 [Mycena rosella]|uniref:Cytochrome P450 n=1 Tax=Mycena rosella TaxID=1033263 RepID=A0AAD7GCI5_MYCRO|nr:hypothetical protein B0H17DRAFT_1139944 [Mycena rosella]